MIADKLRAEKTQVSAISVGAHMQVLQSVTGLLGGFYEVLGSLTDLGDF